MLCSVSKSNWLDRLRSTRDLSPEPQNTTPVTSLSTPHQDVPVSAILSHLFIMDECTPRFRKLPRKQTNPKFHSTSSTSNGLGENCSDNNSNNLRGKDDEVAEEEEDDVAEGSEKEMKGYSRSEVAVIDTSYEVWKFDKLVFRKNAVWKIRDKKGKAGDFKNKKKKNKKRKGNEFEFRNGNLNKKSKVFDHNKSQENRKEEISLDSSGALSQVPRNRLKFSRSARKFEKSGSSSVLIRAIPTEKRIGKTPPKNHVKDA